ncbi:MAG TPA: enoyl-CoA hydratase [Myxococcota bacterium]|nr:enoyl-CoA hydratase [Myxococcota bacterium]
MSQTVLVEQKDGVATVTLNRPDKMNALTTELLQTLERTLRQLADDSGVRVVVLTGAGERAFSAGADLAPTDGPSPADRTARARQTLEESYDALKRLQEASWTLHTMAKPTLAAINGAAAGASLSMALACDIRVASQTAIFATAFARIGFSGDFGGSYFLTKLVGSAKAREMYLLNERIDAAEARRIGLLYRVFAPAAFRAEVDALARRIADGPPLSYRYMKRHLNLALHGNLRDVLDLEAEAMMYTGRSEDFAEGVRAFLGKEKPKFTGR